MAVEKLEGRAEQDPGSVEREPEQPLYGGWVTTPERAKRFSSATTNPLDPNRRTEELIPLTSKGGDAVPMGRPSRTEGPKAE
ncbi:hypothetical protein A2714_03960 [Candidatus Woesebacteria bacterium RIFCSPHIGHO2_01_FULL_38_9]|uniref:Uncharacterized protein n=2 Tax=Candidatus Woeseibacteriota TaxID=1752722 RepID=A0A1F7XZN0_9BACT|nr:MAG: hypothetical protein A2714_03960 [Candidatus Woesebacteria bacterium RIFCSPHIGHO2_01_FULL_38_9]OGM60065.1 MAG: hypothetical protein A3A75_01525 [Candidatus Woesebacteria bacterium RIFCSPLOWO2_01_FULL_39_10]